MSGVVDSVSTLVTAKLLNPPGYRTKRALRWFAPCEVLRLSEDIKWLDLATNTVHDRAGGQGTDVRLGKGGWLRGSHREDHPEPAAAKQRVLQNVPAPLAIT